MTQRRAVYSRFPFIYAPEEAFREIYRQARRIFAKLAGQVINRVELLSTASSLLSNSFNRIVSRHICFFYLCELLSQRPCTVFLSVAFLWRPCFISFDLLSELNILFRAKIIARTVV